MTEPDFKQVEKVSILAEDLRDGLQGAFRMPTYEEMVGHIELLVKLGVDQAVVGIYTSSDNPLRRKTEKLLEYLNKHHPKFKPMVYGLITKESMDWLASCKEKNKNITAIMLIGTAPARLYVENWDLEYILSEVNKYINKCVHEYDMDVMGGIEHATQTPPESLKKIITAIVQGGAGSLGFGDTIGYIRPRGVFHFIRFVKATLRDLDAEHLGVDWHGHNDLGNALTNALTAIAYGANRIHTVSYGFGERAGNLSMEKLILNLSGIYREKGVEPRWRLDHLAETIRYFVWITGHDIPQNGVLGRNAFKTTVGIHTSALGKFGEIYEQQMKQGNIADAEYIKQVQDQVYTPFNPELVGLEHEVAIGPLSGKSTVKLYFSKYMTEHSLTDKHVDLLLREARLLSRELTKAEITDILKEN